MRAALFVAMLVAAAPAAAADLSVLERFGAEPSVRELQHAAAQVASVQPERVRSWLRRASREGQRLSSHREELLTRIADLYFARRRLQVDAVLAPDAPGAVDRALE